MNKDIKKFLIKVELNSDSYITGEFLFRNKHQINLLNSIYINGDKIVLPNVTLNISDVKSIVRLNESESDSYLHLVSSKNMLEPSEKCVKCSKKEEESTDELSGIKTIEEGFDSVSEESSVDSDLKFNVEPRISDSSEEDESSSISDDEAYKEAFKKKLAARNIAVTFKEEIVESDNKKFLPQKPGDIKPQIHTTISKKDSKDIQIDLKNLNLNRNTSTKPPQRNNQETGTADDISKLNRRKDNLQHNKGQFERDQSRRRVFQRTDHSNQAQSKPRIVCGWKQRKYKDGFEILKGLSAGFSNSFVVPKGWSDGSGEKSEETGRSAYHEGLKKN